MLMAKQLSNVTCGVDPDWLSKHIHQHQPYLDKLNSLCARGIDLNPWQVNELLMGGRAYGRTYLAYVKIAEDALGRDLIVTRDVAISYDPDVTSHHTYRDFSRGLERFLDDHYADIIDVEVNMERMNIKLKLARCWWK